MRTAAEGASEAGCISARVVQRVAELVCGIPVVVHRVLRFAVLRLQVGERAQRRVRVHAHREVPRDAVDDLRQVRERRRIPLSLRTGITHRGHVVDELRTQGRGVGEHLLLAGARVGISENLLLVGLDEGQHVSALFPSGI